MADTIAAGIAGTGGITGTAGTMAGTALTVMRRTTGHTTIIDPAIIVTATSRNIVGTIATTAGIRGMDGGDTVTVGAAAGTAIANGTAIASGAAAMGGTGTEFGGERKLPFFIQSRLR